MIKYSVLFLVLIAASAGRFDRPIDEPLLYNNSTSGFAQFFAGVYEGLQRVPNASTGCSRDFEDTFESFGETGASLLAVFTNLDINYIFDAQNNLKESLQFLSSAVDRCELPRLTEEIKTLFTAAGISGVTTRLIFRIGEIQSIIKELPGKLVNDTRGAGVDVGELLSLVLDYKI